MEEFTTKEILELSYKRLFEKKIGKKQEFWNENDLSEFCGFQYDIAVKRLDCLKEAGDTYLTIPWNEFKNLCIREGFRIGYRQNFFNEDEDTQEEEEIIMTNCDKGLVIHAESSYDTIEKATLYGEIKDLNSGEIHNLKMDIQQGFLLNLRRIEEKYEFVNPWKNIHNLSFLNAIESETFNSGKMITKSKIKMMRKSDQKMMNYK